MKNFKLTIEFNEKTSWTVSYDDFETGHLTFDEMLGLVASATINKHKFPPCLHWLEPKLIKQENK